MNKVEIIGYLAGSLTTIAFLPQVVKASRTKSTHDISLLMFSLFSMGVFLWFIYGLFLNSLPVIIANAVVLVFALLILIMKLKYK